ncbi:hypothetical protein [Streptomyces bauhiniae]|uniref:hypothetical protein n=1 Tax=Streptomyces bauhiniae TaxID=2340725 RepID=UPI0035E0BE18
MPRDLTVTVYSPNEASLDLASRLRGDLGRLARTSYFNAPVLSSSDRAKIESIVAKWRPLAEKYRCDARGSAASRARWEALLDAAREPEPGPVSTDPLTVYSGAQELLRALHEAQRPGPTVQQLSQRIRLSITSGTYPPGSVQNVRDLAREVGLMDKSFIRIELALRDLEAKGQVTLEARKRFRVNGTETADRVTYVTALLRELIDGGAFGGTPTRLPSTSDLARSLIATYTEVRQALDKLAEDGLVALVVARRRALRADLLVAKSPPAISDLAAQLRAHAGAGTGPTNEDVRNICRRVRNWWRMRSTPTKDELDHAVATLRSVTERLVQRAAATCPDGPYDIAHMRWAAILASSTPPDDLSAQAWRAACLSVAVLRVLNLTKQDSPPQIDEGTEDALVACRAGGRERLLLTRTTLKTRRHHMSTLTTDHPAWATQKEGGVARAARTATGLWILSHDQRGPHAECVEGADSEPVLVPADPANLPSAAPAALRDGLTGLGTTHRLANPWLWDAITTAILRQVVRAGQARKLYRAWCFAYGTTIDRPQGTFSVAPAPAQVLALSEQQFQAVGAKFHRTALQAAAEQYGRHHGEWEALDAPSLATALTGIPRIGPWTAATAAADYTGDFSVYPHDDLAVRTWAERIAPAYPWPGKKDKSFLPLWTGWAGTDRTALHTLTLSTLTWGSHDRSEPEDDPCSSYD